MENSFFALALKRAAYLIGKPGRVMRILAELAPKINRVDWSAAGRTHLKNQILLISRLIKANITGAYKIKPRLLVGLLAACIYFLNPFDLIPDLIVGVGLIDDMTILAWVYSTAAVELETFEAWEKQATSALL